MRDLYFCPLKGGGYQAIFDFQAFYTKSYITTCFYDINDQTKFYCYLGYFLKIFIKNYFPHTSHVTEMGSQNYPKIRKWFHLFPFYSANF